MSCYQILNDTIREVGEVACGKTNDTISYVPCCVSAGICLTDSLCQSTHSVQGGSGYYVGGCTDPTFSDASCQKRCTSENGLPDAVWNASRNLWQCCGQTNGVPHCANPTEETFLAPAPKALIAYYTPSTANQTTASSTSAASPTGSETTIIIPSSSSESSSGLSTGAQIGIGVGVGVGGALALLVLGIFLHRRRASKKSAGVVSHEGAYESAQKYGSPPTIPPTATVAHPTELEASRAPVELPASTKSATTSITN